MSEPKPDAPISACWTKQNVNNSASIHVMQKKLNLTEGQQVHVISRRGSVQVETRLTKATHVGTLFLTFHSSPNTRQHSHRQRQGRIHRLPRIQSFRGARRSRCGLKLLKTMLHFWKMKSPQNPALQRTSELGFVMIAYQSSPKKKMRAKSLAKEILPGGRLSLEQF